MKIGILTFHRAHNYGAMLQAFALHLTLRRLGHSVEFINYLQPQIEDAYKIWIFKYKKDKSFLFNIKSFISNIITLRRRFLRWNKFNCFRSKYLPESIKYTKEILLHEKLKYDAVFFGSDQIWTTRFLGDFDEIFWGNINLKGKKIAYAPSMELKYLTDTEIEFIKRNIENFSNISVREVSLENMLSKICNREIQIVLDPTLLCTLNDYEQLIRDSKFKIDSSYILVYEVGHYKQVQEVAQKVSNLLGLPIIEIGSDILLHSSSIYRDNLSPADFISLFKKADFVVSGSFHGTAFSVNFHKPFYSVLIDGIDSRAISFLSQVNMLDRGIRSVDEVDKNKLLDIDFTDSDLYLERLRKESLNYINKSLK